MGLTSPVKVPTAEDLKRVEELTAEAAAKWSEFQDFKKAVSGEEELKELSKTETYQALLAKYRELTATARKLTADPAARGDFVWLFRRK